MYEIRAKSSSETDLLMYGSIGEWARVNALDFIRNLQDLKAKGYEKVNLKINSPGGGIFEGIAIISQMSSQEIFITGTVEGIAASMMSVVLQACHKRRMVKGTMLMIHQGESGVIGSANYIRNHADLLDSMNKIIADVYAKRSKRKDAKWILDNWMAEGKDTWFTAEKALEEGLIDEIVDGKVKPLVKERASLTEMAAHYQQSIDTTETTMNKEELIKQFGLKADATDADILAAIADLKAKAAPPAPPKADDSAAKEDATTVIDGVAAIAKERGMTDAQVESVKILAKTDVKAAMALIPAAKKAEEKQETTTNINDVLKALKGGGGDDAKADRKNWKYNDWQKKDSAGLLAMAKDNPADWIKLFEAQYGYAPSQEEIKKLLAQ